MGYAGLIGATSIYLPALARTATVNGSEIKGGWAGCSWVIDVTAKGTAPSVVPTIEAWDEASNKWLTILTGAAITGVSQVVLVVSPDVAAAANLAITRRLPPITRLTMTAANSDSLTYSVGLWLEP